MDALTEAIADREYTAASLRENADARDGLAGCLKNLGMAVFPSGANYVLLELPEGMPAAAQLRERMIEKHRILIRSCDSYEGLASGRYVRVAVRSEAENGRLIEALGEELMRVRVGAFR
jgi:threonine-phosphate decarboxylase